MRQFASFELNEPERFKTKALAYSKQFFPVCYLDSNDYKEDKYAGYDCLIAIGAEKSIQFTTEQASFAQLQSLYDSTGDWLFGYLSYDLKNEVEKLTSDNLDGIAAPPIHFFQPSTLIKMKGSRIDVHSFQEPSQAVFEAIMSTAEPVFKPYSDAVVSFTSRMGKAEYIAKVEQIKSMIAEGDFYEMNFCQEFYMENADIDPCSTFITLNSIAKAPFSAFYKVNDIYLLCSSPERFLKKEGDKIISQPIKGTIKRGTDEAEDLENKKGLRNSLKDQAENVMIVDLVRNDLARSCTPGSVKVEELFGIYSFPGVHQMVSTVTGTKRDDVSITDIIKNAFPMGSMTGAPKIIVMQTIEKLENAKRGIFSGAVGYITPEGNFDFNVVIRSLLYNQAQGYLSLQAGGAITFDSIPEDEYEECLVKARKIFELFKQEAQPAITRK